MSTASERFIQNCLTDQRSSYSLFHRHFFFCCDLMEGKSGLDGFDCSTLSGHWERKATATFPSLVLGSYEYITEWMLGCFMWRRLNWCQWVSYFSFDQPDVLSTTSLEFRQSHGFELYRNCKSQKKSITGFTAWPIWSIWFLFTARCSQSFNCLINHICATIPGQWVRGESNV